MDKNTITGLLLMAVVMFGFMWLNQPSEEELAEQRKQQQAQQEQQAQAKQSIEATDTLSASEIRNLATVVASYGTQMPDGSKTVNDENVALTWADGQVSGSIALADTTVSLDAVINRSLAPLTYNQAMTAVRRLANNTARYKNFAASMTGSDTTVVLENELLSLEVSSKGGIISSAVLKTYDNCHNEPVRLFTADTDSYSFVLNATDTRYDTKDFYFVPTQLNDSTLLMTLDLGEAKFGLRYTLPHDSYLVKMEVVQEHMNKVIPVNIADMGFNWQQKMVRNEKGRMFEERNSAIYYKFSKGDVDNLNENGDDDERINDKLKWIGFKNQFFSSVIIPDKYFLGANLESKSIGTDNADNALYLKNMNATANLDYSSEAPVAASFHFFFGPNKYPLLSSYDDVISPDEDLDLTRLIPLGWSFFRFINTVIIIPIFNFLGGYVANYGIIILLLTLFIKLILFPLTYKSMISQAKMRLLAPDIKAINDKYPGQENAMTRQQKTMALYSQAGASPFSGCLPMLLQLPILFAMFTFFPSCIELRGEPFLWVKDLSAPDAIVSWNAQIPFITNYFGNHISLFCLLMTVTNIIYTRINMQNQGGSQMPGMKIMMYAMPIMFLVFFNNYAAGLSYYYFISLLITIIQTYVFRHFVSEKKLREVMAQNAKKPKKKSGFMARLEEAQRQQQAAIRAQQQQQKKGKH